MFYTGHSNSERSGLVNKMTNSVYEMPTDEYNKKLAEALKQIPEFEVPDWAEFVKTGAHVERPPAQENWWHIRQAALLRTIYKDGPVGVSKLRTKYGGRRNRGLRPHRFQKAGGKIIRTMLQQLEKAGLVKQAKQGSKAF